MLFKNNKKVLLGLILSTVFVCQSAYSFSLVSLKRIPIKNWLVNKRALKAGLLSSIPLTLFGYKFIRGWKDYNTFKDFGRRYRIKKDGGTRPFLDDISDPTFYNWKIDEDLNGINWKTAASLNQLTPEMKKTVRNKALQEIKGGSKDIVFESNEAPQNLSLVHVGKIINAEKQKLKADIKTLIDLTPVKYSTVQKIWNKAKGTSTHSHEIVNKMINRKWYTRWFMPIFSVKYPRTKQILELVNDLLHRLERQEALHTIIKEGIETKSTESKAKPSTSQAKEETSKKEEKTAKGKERAE